MAYTHDLSAKFHKPEDTSKTLAVLLPGFLFSKDYKNFTSLGDILKENNITTVRFDPTGTWESGADIEHYSITQYLSDIEQVIEFSLTEKKYENVILIGHSMGGLVANLFASEFEEISTTVAIFSPSSVGVSEYMKAKLPNWKESGSTSSKRQAPDSEEIVEIDTPYSFFEDASSYDGKSAVSNLEIPKLFLAAGLDVAIADQHVKHFFDAAAQPKDYLLLKGVEHNYWIDNKQLAEVNLAVLDFLKEYDFIDEINFTKP